MIRLLILTILLAFPAAEGALLFQLANGPSGSGAWVLAWVFFAAAAGIVLIQQARFSLLARLAGALGQGKFSLAALIDSFRTVLAGLLLIFPGLISDALALMVLLWPVREPAFQSAVARSPSQRSARVIDGEFRREG
ncbi:MAG: FxsA family protein [Betaproteobacteria bacterium]|nr:FxsA family protein [Betaproteobacteria bacterium]